MAINIKDPATEGAVRELAAATGASITDTVRGLAEAALEQIKADRAADKERRRAAIMAISEEASRMPTADPRPIEVITKELLGGL